MERRRGRASAPGLRDGRARHLAESHGQQTLEVLGRLHGGVDPAYRAELVTRFSFDPSQKGRSYSTGNRQKVALIAALSTRADLLVLDEPTSGLDPLMKAMFEDCVREARRERRTVLLSSHVLAEVEAVCDRVGILRRGRLVDSGTLDELRHLSGDDGTSNDGVDRHGP